MPPRRAKKTKTRQLRRRTYAPLWQAPAEIVAFTVTDNERAFFFEWSGQRNLDKVYVVLSLTYWARVKSKIWTCFLERPKEMYMIICIHVALKWLGYDETLKCDFVNDLRGVGAITMEAHQTAEFLVLSELGWEL